MLALFCSYKVAAIKVDHTRFLPILAHRAVNFGALFMKISMYVYFGYTKNGSNFFFRTTFLYPKQTYTPIFMKIDPKIN